MASRYFGKKPVFKLANISVFNFSTKSSISYWFIRFFITFILSLRSSHWISIIVFCVLISFLLKAYCCSSIVCTPPSLYWSINSIAMSSIKFFWSFACFSFFESSIKSFSLLMLFFSIKKLSLNLLIKSGADIIDGITVLEMS